MINRRQQEVGDRRGNISASTGKVSTGHDKLGGKPVTPQIPRSCGMVHPDSQVLVDFKMEVGRVHAVIGPDRADLLALGDLLPFPDIDPVEMGIE